VKANFSQWLRRVKLEGGRPIALCCVALAVVGQVTGNNIMLVTGLTAAALMLVEAVYEIYAYVREKSRPSVFNGYREAFDHFEARVLRELDRGRPVEVRWLAISMNDEFSGLQRLIDRLRENPPVGQCSLQIAIVAPTWPKLPEVNPYWANTARQRIDQLEEWKQVLGKEFEDGAVRLEHHAYNHMPNWHGFSLNDRSFYISHCGWKNDRLGSGSYPFELIEDGVDNGGEPYNSHCDLFRSWFERCFSSAKKASA
jgi:hypothetical protein